MNIHVDIRQSDGTVIHVGSTPTDSPDLSDLVNVGHVTRMIRFGARRQLLTEAGCMVMVRLDGGELVNQAHAALAGDLSVLDIEAGLREAISGGVPGQGWRWYGEWWLL